LNGVDPSHCMNSILLDPLVEQSAQISYMIAQWKSIGLRILTLRVRILPLAQGGRRWQKFMHLCIKHLYARCTFMDI
jgi:hypothetical protein